jgi:hypothetical protein
MSAAALAKHAAYVRLVLLLLGLVMVQGCQTFEAKNTANIPWNRPTRWDMDGDWLFWPYDYHRRPGDNYP